MKRIEELSLDMNVAIMIYHGDGIPLTSFWNVEDVKEKLSEFQLSLLVPEPHQSLEYNASRFQTEHPMYVAYRDPQEEQKLVADKNEYVDYSEVFKQVAFEKLSDKDSSMIAPVDKFEFLPEVFEILENRETLVTCEIFGTNTICKLKVEFELKDGSRTTIDAVSGMLEHHSRQNRMSQHVFRNYYKLDDKTHAQILQLLYSKYRSCFGLKEAISC